jgi:hypothetical protein
VLVWLCITSALDIIGRVFFCAQRCYPPPPPPPASSLAKMGAKPRFCSVSGCEGCLALALAALQVAPKPQVRAARWGQQGGGSGAATRDKTKVC